MSRPFSRNCPIRQHTADKVSVGRCWHFLSIGADRKGLICPIHGEVSEAVAAYIKSNTLTNDFDLPRREFCPKCVQYGGRP